MAGPRQAPLFILGIRLRGDRPSLGQRIGPLATPSGQDMLEVANAYDGLAAIAAELAQAVKTEDRASRPAHGRAHRSA